MEKLEICTFEEEKHLMKQQMANILESMSDKFQKIFKCITFSPKFDKIFKNDERISMDGTNISLDESFLLKLNRIKGLIKMNTQNPILIEIFDDCDFDNKDFINSANKK
ncbi:MAG: hypothetical protein MHPSP_000773, partial [Paramarteilia canceri]